MKTLLLLFLLIGCPLFAEYSEPSVLTGHETAPADEGASAQEQSIEQPSAIHQLFSNFLAPSLTLEYHTLPAERTYVGEIVAVTLKATPAELGSEAVEYTLQNSEGIRIFSDIPRRDVREDGVYDTFSFLILSASARLPDITATVSATGSSSNVLTGVPVDAMVLNPPRTFANVLADRFEIVTYKTTPYNNESNIVIFTAKASRCHIDAFALPDALKQGFESKLSNVGESQMTYYAVVPDSEETLTFSYFNLKKQRYESLVIPIIVDDDTVSTMSDLSPTDTRHTELKMTVSVIAIAGLIGLFYWKRRRGFLYVSLVPLAYLLYVLLPNQTVCVKQDAPIYLLPIAHGTVFERTKQQENMEAEKEVGDFIKVHLNDDQIGWVHKRDLCSN